MVNTITAFPEDTTQIEAIKAFMNALKIKFTVAQKKEKPYDPAFVAKILQSQQDYKEGKGIKINIEDLENLCK